MAKKHVQYSKQIADEIIEFMCSGGSVLQYTKQPNTPSESTIYRWIDEDRDGFGSRYARAREMRIELIVDRIQDIADNVNEDAIAIAKAKLQIENMRWYAEKVKPKLYGNKLEVNDVSKAKTLVMIVTDGDIDEPDPEDE